MQQLTKHRIKAGIITGIIFGALVLIMLWIHFHTPNPPYPEGGGGPGMGLEVNLGSDDVGMGDEQNSSVVAVPDFQPKVEEEAKAEKILTDDTEEDAIKIPSVEDKEKKKVTKKEKVKETKKEKTVTVAEQPKVNQKAMFPAQNKSNEGNTGQAGDQGKANGTANSPLYTGNGNGSGGGTGGGSGTGNGTGVGDGISFSLDGRISSYLGKPEYKGQAEGKVVVEITVDKNGRVINAIPGVKGSTTLDEDLLQVAKQAALLSTFNKKSSATVQKGTITYRFILQ